MTFLYIVHVHMFCNVVLYCFTRKGFICNKDYYIISCGSVLLVEETGLPGENHRPVASH